MYTIFLWNNLKCREYDAKGIYTLWLNSPNSVVNHIDPYPAISACVVFPHSGHICPEERPFFQNFPHFSKIEPYSLTAHRSPIYHVKAHGKRYLMRNTLVSTNKYV